MNELSNFEIIDLIKHHKLKYYFGGVYSKDQLPELKPTKFYIINLQDSNDGGGTHWTAFYYSKLQSIFFDSYGFPAPIEVENKIGKYIYNDADIQDYDSSSCGYYALAFIKFLHNKTNKEEAFKIFLKLFKNETVQNDRILYNLLYDK
jgi:hypothetical protein